MKNKILYLIIIILAVFIGSLFIVKEFNNPYYLGINCMSLFAAMIIDDMK